MWQYANNIDEVYEILEGTRIFKVEEYEFLSYKGSRSQPMKLINTYKR